MTDVAQRNGNPGSAGSTGPERLVVICASAGGIDAITEVVSGLAADLPAAVIIVQHLMANFPTHLPEIISRRSVIPARLAEHGAPLRVGTAYVAPPGKHLKIDRGRIVLDNGQPVRHVRPSADVLFASAAKGYGPGVIGVVLSGTGRDGTEGCRAIRDRSGVTIAQNRETSAFFDMPAAAIKAQVVDHVLPISGIASRIIELLDWQSTTGP